MRIHSDFNDQNLYRRGRVDSTREIRRIVRLSLALGVVLLFMSVAADPAIYAPFFPQQDPRSGGQPAPARGVQATPLEPVSDRSATPTAADLSIARQLVALIAPRDQSGWSVGLIEFLTTPPDENPQEEGHQAGRPRDFPEIGALTQLIATSSQLSLSQVERGYWEQTLQAIPSGVGPAQRSDPTHRLAAGLLEALDEAAIQRVVDGSVWVAGDFDALYRFLDQATRPLDQVTRSSNERPVQTNVVSLLQQPDVYRNQNVRVTGSVARCDRIAAKENPFGFTEYWQLWLRPSDGAIRPIVAIVPAAPESVRAVSTYSEDAEGPAVVVDGKYLKRLAYQSSMGADLAPVIVGSLETEPVAVAKAAPVVEDIDRRALWLIPVACGLGLLLAGVGVWRNAVAARRSRALRDLQSTIPLDADFASAFESTSSSESMR